MKNFTAPYHNRHIVVTGGGGYLGSAAVAALLSLPCTITVVDRQEKPSWVPEESPAHLHWLKSDVTDGEAWKEIVVGADVIWHMAAIEEPYSPKNIARDWEVNAASVVHMMEACRAQQIHPRVVIASSANIYGQVASVPVTEKTPDNPGRLWSAHKLLAEQYARLLGQPYSVPTTILRLANLYGPATSPGSDAHIVINKVLRQALAGGGLTLFSNAECLRDYVYIDDAVAAFFATAMANPNAFSRYVVGSGEAVTIEETWRRIARIAEQMTGKKVSLAMDATRELDQAENRQFVADSRKFFEDTSWQPSLSLESGLTTTAEWLLNNERKPGMMQSYATSSPQKKHPPK